MRIENKQLYSFIKDAGLIESSGLESAYIKSQEGKKRLGDILIADNLISEVKLRELYAYILGVPFVDLAKEIVSPEVLQTIPEAIAKKYKVVAFEKVGRELRVAMLNPDDIQTIDFIRKKTGMRITTCLTTEDGIETMLKQYEKSLKAEFGDIIDKNLAEVSDENDLEKVAQGLPIIRIVDTLIKHAILQGASDVHIEPDEIEVRVRYRIDGILHDAMTLPKQVKDGIIARIKVLSNLKLDEHRVPQDGRFKIEKENLKISFRVSVLPIFDGEKIVMRLLDETSKGLTLEKMGLTGLGLEVVHRQVKKPNGMILVTGPTGSGKTTTLYTVMDILNTPEVNISTIEDPVEYRMHRVNQTQIHAKVGLTFAAGLRSLLRQDPDIIMVGEIRDQETLEMAIHAALTGHLVLSTLHTNSAAATLPRIIDMGAEPFMVASTVNVIIAQRLVRKLCVDCKKSYKLTPKELESLNKNYDMQSILKIAKDNETSKGFVKPKSTWKDIVFYKASGCDQCGGEGYKGRSGIYEVLEVDSDIEKMISDGSSSDEVEKKAKSKGMLTMVEDGFIKAIAGTTSIEEILRVTKE